MEFIIKSFGATPVQIAEIGQSFGFMVRFATDATSKKSGLLFFGVRPARRRPTFRDLTRIEGCVVEHMNSVTEEVRMRLKAAFASVDAAGPDACVLDM